MHTAGQSIQPDFAPISTYVLKIASRCNLNCRYCYMYNLGDTTYLGQPSVMPREVVDATIARIKQHALRWDLTCVRLILHGGEPLLAGEEFFRYFVEAANRALKPDVKPRFSMQTNGILLSRPWLEVLSALGINFGISLDGPPAVHDGNRVDHLGRGSHRRVLEAIELIKDWLGSTRIPMRGLAVVDPTSDPLAVYNHIRGLGLAGVDFLLPDGTYDVLPPALSLSTQNGPYADWLIPIFNAWFDDPDSSFTIRVFEDIVKLILGAGDSTDYIGGGKGSVIVIETDGGLEPTSALKVCGEGFTKAGISVLGNEIDELYDLPLFREYLLGADALCSTCRQCPIVRICGGGYIPHRYRQANGFDNPSIYCRDLTGLITHVQQRVSDAFPFDVHQARPLT